MDYRVKKAAEIIVNYSTKIKAKEYVQIIFDDQAFPLAKEVYKLVIQKGGFPVMKGNFNGLSKFYFDNANEWQLTRPPKEAIYEMKNTDVVIYIGGTSNTRELSNINPKKMGLRQKTYRKLSDIRMKKRWLIYEYPTNALAQDADMSLEEFENFVYSSTNIDWSKTSKRLHALAKIVNQVDEVRITGEDTDLKFRIKGRNCVPADGRCNMPDGEVFTAPIEDSTNGNIFYSLPAIYGGREVSGIRLKFKHGRVVEALAAKNQDFLVQMLDTDKGGRVLGEFGIGMNYNINKFVKQILFDEKIGGSIHLALGAAYPECRGENKSAIHWDMIKDLREGGKIYFDGKLVQKNGSWLMDF